MANLTNRAAFIDGLLAMADLIKSNPDVALPHTGTVSEFAHFTDSAAEAAAWAEVLTGKKVKVENDRNYPVRLTGTLHGLRVLIYLHVDACPKIVKGTKVVEDVDYDTSSLLGESVSV